MSRIPKGTRVSVDFSKAPDSYGLPHSISKGKIYKGVVRDDEAIEFDENVGGWDDGRCWHCPDECLTPLNAYVIPFANMKRIYDVACDGWKDKLSSMIKPFEEHFICSNDFAKEMISAATSEQKIVVIEVLTQAGYKAPVDKSKKYHVFDTEEDRMLITDTSCPIYLRNGLASDESMQFREVGFGSNFKPILVDEEGNETVLSSKHYLKFKIK